jgi:hypothetical protein
LNQETFLCYIPLAVPAGKPMTVKEMGWRRFGSTSFVEDAMMKATESQFIESTAGQVAAELARRGIAPDQHVTVVVEPDDWIAEARRFSRQKVIEAGWSDDDIDRLIKQAQQEVEHLLPEGDSLSIPTFLSVRH